MNRDDVHATIDRPVPDRGLGWFQEMQRALHAAHCPTRLSSDERGCELLVPFRGVLYDATVKTLAELAAKHNGVTVVDFAQGGVRFLPPRAPAEGAVANA